jgi:hypothetical protein
MIKTATKSSITNALQFIFVSIVIVALVAILFPVLVKARSHSKLIVSSNMADIGRALEQYSIDNDNSLPCGSCSFGPPSRPLFTGLGWAGEIMPYVSDSRIFDDHLGLTLPDPSEGSIVSFAFNSNAAIHARPARWTSPNRTVILCQVQGAHTQLATSGVENSSSGRFSPATDGTDVLLLDGLNPRDVLPATGDVGLRAADSATDIWPAPAVDGGSFYLMGDGHVVWAKAEKVSSGESALSEISEQIGGASGHAAGTQNVQYLATFSTR